MTDPTFKDRAGMEAWRMETEKFLIGEAAMAGWIYTVRICGKLIALKSPNYIALFSERYRMGVRVIPLAFGWRITIRKAP